MSIDRNIIKDTALVSVFLLITVFAAPASAGLLSSKSNQKSVANQPIQDKINAYNEQAVQLFEEGRFKEAQELWEKAIQMMEQPEKYTVKGKKPKDAPKPAAEALALLREKEEEDIKDVEDLYEEAVRLFKGQKYVTSKKMFDQVEMIVPGYRATRNYLMILSHKIKRVQQTLGKERFKENVAARREERAEWRRIVAESEKKLKLKLKEQVDPLYKEALQLYKSRKFKLAKDYFAEAENTFPGYKDTGKYLTRIDEDIQQEEKRLMEEKRKRELLARKKEKEEWQRILEESARELQKKLKEQAEPVYRQAIDAYKKRRFELAKSRFQEVELIVPSYRSTAQYLQRIDQDIADENRLAQERKARELARKRHEEELARKREDERLEKLREAEKKDRVKRFREEMAIRKNEREEWLKVIEEAERQRKQKMRDQAEFVYQEAIRHYKNAQFVQARESFQEVERIFPDYRSTVKYLARVDKNIKEEEEGRLADREMAFQKKLREKKLAERQKEEEQQQLQVIEGQKRLRKLKEEALAREKQRREWDRIMQENEKELQKRLEREAEFAYREAVDLYEAKRWDRARSGFLEVEKILPGYKTTGKYLANIDRDIQKEEEQRREKAREISERQKREEALVKQQVEERRQRDRKAEEQRQLRQQEKQAEAIYKYARSLYKQGKYVQAKEKFLETAKILPGYKASDKYLRRIDKDIIEDEKQRQKEQQLAFKRRAKEHRLEQKREEERLDRLRRIEEEQRLQNLREEALLRQKERKEWEKTVTQIEAEYQKRLRQQTESIYQEALRYYNAGWFEQAEATFEEVDVMQPDYKSTAKYLAKIDTQIRKSDQLRQESEEEIWRRQLREEKLAKQREEIRQRQIRKKEERKRLKRLKEEALVRRKEKERLKESFEQIQKKYQNRLRQQADAIYRTALDHYKAGAFEKARETFVDVESVMPGYKATRKYLARLDDDIKKKKERRINFDSSVSDTEDMIIQKTAEDRRKALLNETKKKYREARGLYKAKEFVRAKLLFIEVESLWPGYKSTPSYLKKIDKKIALQQERLKQERQVISRKEKRMVETVKPKRGGQRQTVVEQALLQVEGGFQKRELKEIPALSHEKHRKEKRKIRRKRDVRDQRKDLKAQRKKVQREYEKEFRQLYAKAVKLYRSGSYDEAQGIFLQIERMRPGYKKAASYLKKTEAKIRRGIQKTNSNVVLQRQKSKTRDSAVEEALNMLEQSL